MIVISIMPCCYCTSLQPLAIQLAETEGWDNGSLILTHNDLFKRGKENEPCVVCCLALTRIFKALERTTIDDNTIILTRTDNLEAIEDNNFKVVVIWDPNVSAT